VVDSVAPVRRNEVELGHRVAELQPPGGELQLSVGDLSSGPSLRETSLAPKCAE
jgi:hypothetical protein